MDRRAEILKYVSKTALGIEIAPWHAPIAPKREGYNVTIFDVLSTEELLHRASIDSGIQKDSLGKIEAVDFVGSAVDIESLVTASHPPGSFDYIISSHNFEHLPNPIKFLQGCQKLLKRGGKLSMAIPDFRACFDHFRWPTTIADWLAAYVEDRVRPTLKQCFDQRTQSCILKNPPGREQSFSVDDNAANMELSRGLREAYAAWVDALKAGSKQYNDTHCSVMTGTSFRLLLAECRFLGLTELALLESTGPVGCEFFVHLENQGPARDMAVSCEPFYRLRAQLTRQIADETAQVSAWAWSCRHGVSDSGSQRILLSVALEHHAEGRFGAAAQIYQQLSAADNSDCEVLFLMGVLCCDLRLYDEAVRFLEKALATSPNFPEADRQLALARKGQAVVNGTSGEQAPARESPGHPLDRIPVHAVSPQGGTRIA